MAGGDIEGVCIWGEGGGGGGQEGGGDRRQESSYGWTARESEVYMGWMEWLRSQFFLPTASSPLILG